MTNLTVREVSGGNTADDLGLGNIDVAASEATGDDVVRIFEQLNVRQLNDGTGLSIRDELPDLEIQFRDGSAALQIDLQQDDISTFGDLLDALNAADPARLSAEISSDGKRLVLTDLTADSGGTFSVSSAAGGTLAEDLGLTGSAAGGVLTGRRLISGLQGTTIEIAWLAVPDLARWARSASPTAAGVGDCRSFGRRDTQRRGRIAQWLGRRHNGCHQRSAQWRRVARYYGRDGQQSCRGQRRCYQCRRRVGHYRRRGAREH